VPGACRRLSVVAVAGGTALADTRALGLDLPRPPPLGRSTPPSGCCPYPVTLFDQSSAGVASATERWVDQEDAGLVAVLPMLSFQLTEYSADDSSVGDGNEAHAKGGRCVHERHGRPRSLCSAQVASAEPSRL
jgi:hypothetical protein